MTIAKRAVVTLASTTGLPRDDVENVFHFAPGDTNANIVSALQDFYIGDVGGTVTPLGAFLGGSISRASLAARVEIYDVPDAPGPVGSPVFTGFFTIPAAGTATNLPVEVAVCMSFHADLTGISEEVGSTRPRARRRGRVYVGPLNINGAASGQPYPRPHENLIDTLVAAAPATLVTATVHLGVFSQADWALRAAVAGWVDDEFDTQRRRGHEATDRTGFTL